MTSPFSQRSIRARNRLSSTDLLPIPEVNAATDVPASTETEGRLIRVRAVPGTSASILYVCLGDNSSPTTYSWVQVATG